MPTDGDLKKIWEQRIITQRWLEWFKNLEFTPEIVALAKEIVEANETQQE